MQRTVSIIASVLFMSACATNQGNIVASYVSDSNYSPLKCNKLEDERSQLEASLATALAQREVTRAKYLADVIFINLPIFTASGNNVAPELAGEKEIARLKGELEAVHAVSLKKHCPV